MVIDFLSVDFDEDEIDDISDLKKIVEGEYKKTPSILKPNTMMAKDIRRITPSIYDPQWTDVFTSDGDVLVCNQSYTIFKVRWLIALGLKQNQTWEDIKSEDGDVKIRMYLN